MSILKWLEVGNEGTQRRFLSQPSSLTALINSQGRMPILKWPGVGNKDIQRRFLSQLFSPITLVDSQG